MSKIKCKECKNIFKGKGTVCPNCGFKNFNSPLLIKVIIGIFLFFMILAGVIGFLVFKIIGDAAKTFSGSWTNIVEYRDKSTDEFICKVENKIVVDKFNIIVSSDVIDGVCDNENYSKLVSDFEVENGTLKIEYEINDKDYDLYLSYDKDNNYLCLNGCTKSGKKYYKNEVQNEIIYVDNSKKDNSSNDNFDSSIDVDDYESVDDIDYDDFIILKNNLKNSIIIFGADYCNYCKKTAKSFSEILNNKKDQIYYLDTEDLNRREYSSIDADYNISNGIPVIAAYNSSGEEKIYVGMQDDSVLIELLKFAGKM